MKELNGVFFLKSQDVVLLKLHPFSLLSRTHNKNWRKVLLISTNRLNQHVIVYCFEEPTAIKYL